MRKNIDLGFFEGGGNGGNEGNGGNGGNVQKMWDPKKDSHFESSASYF